MNFPSTKEMIEDNEKSQNGLIDLKMFSPDFQEFDENLISWQIDEVTSKAIKISLEFNEYIEVSQGDTPDQLII